MHYVHTMGYYLVIKRDERLWVSFSPRALICDTQGLWFCLQYCLKKRNEILTYVTNYIHLEKCGK